MNKNIRLSKIGWVLSILKNVVILALSLSLTHLLIIGVNEITIRMLIFIGGAILASVITFFKSMDILAKTYFTLKDNQQSMIVILTNLVFVNLIYYMNQNYLLKETFSIFVFFDFIIISLISLISVIIIFKVMDLIEKFMERESMKGYVNKVKKFFEEVDHVITTDLDDNKE